MPTPTAELYDVYDIVDGRVGPAARKGATGPEAEAITTLGIEDIQWAIEEAGLASTDEHVVVPAGSRKPRRVA